MHKTLDVNTEGRDFVIGDLHGALCLLEGFLAHADFDKTKDRVISVGDLVDRGPDSVGCLRLLREPWFHSVMGNHEDLMLNYLASNPIGDWWFQNGGKWWHGITPEIKDEVRSICKDIVQHLPIVITVNKRDGGMFHIVHAEFTGKEPLTDENLPFKVEEQMRWESQDGPFPIWGRSLFRKFYRARITAIDIPKFAREVKMYGVMRHFDPKLSQIFSGHSIMRQPTTIGPQTNIDTCAYGALGGVEDCGLTVCEPLTNRFWTVRGNGAVDEVKPMVIL